MQAKKTEAEVIQEIIAKLAAEGIEAYTEKREFGDEDEPVIDYLRVPAWEKNDGDLCRKAVYAFIHSKLATQPGKGFSASSPLTTGVDVYCYYPPSVEEGRDLTCWDIMIWGVGASFDHFSWEEIVEGDDCAWWEGWDTPTEYDYLERRVANLWILLNYQIVDLPAVEPLTHSELLGILKDPAKSSALFCNGPDYKDRWSLRLAEDDQLVVYSALHNTATPITEANFDKGRLVLDGRVLMHRCFGF